MAETSWEKFVFNTSNFLFSALNIGEDKQTQSGITSFNKKQENGEETDTQSSTRKRDEINPVFLIEQASTFRLLNTSEASLLNTNEGAAASMT